MMRTVIIDDDKAAVQALADKLKNFDEITVEGTAMNGIDGLSLLNDTHPDVVFLDIELPDISGLDFLERMEGFDGGRCRIVMYTAYDRYMLPAFRKKAFDFLVKPIADDDLRTIIHRLCLAGQTTANLPAASTDAGNGIQARGDGKYLLYTNAVDFRLVDVRDIGVFSYNHLQRLWEVYVSGSAKPVRLKRNVNSDALLALDQHLVRVSQRHIINIAYLLEVADNVCRFYPPFDKITDVKVGRFFRKKLIDRFCSI